MSAKSATAKAYPSIDDGKLEEVQLARLQTQLRNLPAQKDLIKAMGEEPERYAAALAKQYAKLAARQPKGNGPQAEVLSPKIVSVLDRFGDIFGWWQRVQSPVLTPALVQTPTSSQTGGQIVASEFAGALSLGGEIYNSGAQEQWWVNTWQCIVPFPAVPVSNTAPGSMSYRFNLAASVAFYRQTIATGSLAVYVTVFKTSDLTGHPITFTNPASSQFAIFAGLPSSEVPPIVGGSANVTGTIPLLPGNPPAIGILIGVILSAAHGQLLITPGSYSIVNFGPPGSTSPSDLGKVEYRMDQRFWVEAVAEQFR